MVTDPLMKAIEALETHVGLAGSELAQSDKVVREAFRTAAIKSFEFTYEHSMKLLVRALENHPGVTMPGADKLTPGQVLRYALERDYIGSFDAWQEFRLNRNKTAHTYEEKIAAEVFAVLPGFIGAAKDLLVRLKEVSSVEA